jgi:hypothetical protein
MQIPTFTLSVLALAFTATANHFSPSSSSAVQALTQAGYKAAWLIDSKNYTAFHEVFTEDIVYDSTELGAYGGETSGIEETTAAIKSAGDGAKTSHLVTNLLVLDMINPKKARVNT